MDLMARIRTGEVLVCDGATGTELIARGLKAGDCPESWCVSRPEAVKEIASAYVMAGADVVETNSFGASSLKLAAYGLQEEVARLNSAAARLAKAAMGEQGYVAGSVGPTGVFVKGEGGQTTASDLYEVFKAQVIALAEGGADVICVETMWSAKEAEQAIRAAKDHTTLPVICTFTFNAGRKGFRTAVGLSPEQAVVAAVSCGANIVGSNCGNGIDQMIEIAKAIRNVLPATPMMIQANAGLPIFENGATVYKESPEYMASRVAELLAAGVNIIGGCCGTTPDHIRALKAAAQAASTR